MKRIRVGIVMVTAVLAAGGLATAAAGSGLDAAASRPGQIGPARR